MSGVSVECLKKITFSLLPLSEKLEIITRGRPTPNILVQSSRVSKTKKFLKNFNRDWYEKIKWLCGCETTNSLFCFPCLLFGGDTVWTQNGFTNISKMKEKTGKHQNSRRHMANMMSLSLLSQINRSDQLNESSEIILKNDKQPKEYREDLSKVIDCLKFTAKLELAFRHGGNAPCNTLETFLSNFNLSFKKHILVFGETPEAVQNELLGHIVEVCRQEIVSEVQEASYVSVICEDVADISDKVETIVVFRYEHEGTVRERFWGFLDSESVTKDGASNCLLNEISKVIPKDWNKLIAHTLKESARGDRSRIQSIYGNARFVQGCSGELDQTLKQMTSSIKSVRLFFAKLASLDRFFKESPLRLAMLHQFIGKSSQPVGSLDVCTVYRIKESLMKFLENFASLKITDKALEASTRYSSLVKSECFLFWLEIFNRIIERLKVFHQEIQSGDASEAPRRVEEFCEEVSEICEGVKFGQVESSKFFECQQLRSCICDEMKERFGFVGHLTAAKLFKRGNFKRFYLELPKVVINEACSAYPDVKKEKLKKELKVLYSQKKFHSLDPLNILKSLTSGSLSHLFGETIKLLKILVTTPMVLDESEEWVPTARKVRSLIGDTVSEEKLTAFCMISVEGEMISQMKNFNEKVVQKFYESGRLKFGLK